GVGAACGACDPGQACINDVCVCNETSCPTGCCDGTGACQTTGMACRSGGAGAACASGCPLTIPQAPQLVPWLVCDTYPSGPSFWTDESGHADATCSNCPSVGSLNGRGAVSFDGSSYFALGDPSGLYQTAAFTVFLVAAPASGAGSNAVLVGFSDGNG